MRRHEEEEVLQEEGQEGNQGEGQGPGKVTSEIPSCADQNAHGPTRCETSSSSPPSPQREPGTTSAKTKHGSSETGPITGGLPLEATVSNPLGDTGVLKDNPIVDDAVRGGGDGGALKNKKKEMNLTKKSRPKPAGAMKKIAKAWPNEDDQEPIAGEFCWMVQLCTVSRVAWSSTEHPNVWLTWRCSPACFSGG